MHVVNWKVHNVTLGTGWCCMLWFAHVQAEHQRCNFWTIVCAGLIAKSHGRANACRALQASQHTL
jgi:hypothetical protein